MPHWNLTVKLKPFWASADPFEEKRDRIVKAFRDSGWPGITSQPGHLESLLDELAEVPDVSAFDAMLGDLYDLADVDRVWIETF